jgi:putative phosphoribosyl transferase
MIEKEISVTIGQTTVEGNLTVPHNARGIVLFAHGSGSGRFSPRNQYVAKGLNKSQIGTLLFDLLTSAEEEEDLMTAEYRFNIHLLAERLVGATEWLKKSSITHALKLAYFGASTGAAAALIAAAKLPNDITTIVSRGGRPDLAEEYLPKVKAPTLLLVGGYDTEVIELNKQAMAKMTAEKKLVIIPSATHLFEEPGKLEEVAKIATEWFLQYLE